MYGYSGLGFDRALAQTQSIQLAQAGADAAQFKDPRARGLKPSLGEPRVSSLACGVPVTANPRSSPWAEALKPPTRTRKHPATWMPRRLPDGSQKGPSRWSTHADCTDLRAANAGDLLGDGAEGQAGSPHRGKQDRCGQGFGRRRIKTEKARGSVPTGEMCKKRQKEAARLSGAVRRYALDGSLYSAAEFQRYYGEGASEASRLPFRAFRHAGWLSAWLDSPMEKRISTDRRAYTANQFFRQESWLTLHTFGKHAFKHLGTSRGSRMFQSSEPLCPAPIPLKPGCAPIDGSPYSPVGPSASRNCYLATLDPVT